MAASALATTSRSAPRATFCTPPAKPSTSSRVLRGQSSSENASVRRAQTPKPSGNSTANKATLSTSNPAALQLLPQRLRVEHLS